MNVCVMIGIENLFVSELIEREIADLQQIIICIIYGEVFYLVRAENLLFHET